MLLSVFIDIVTIYTNPNFVKPPKGLTLLQNLENSYVIQQLKSFIAKGDFETRIAKDSKSVLNDDEEIELINLLRSRWIRIQETNCCYSTNEDIPANKICTALAIELAKTLHIKNHDDLLMPTSKKTGLIESTEQSKHDESREELQFLVSILSDEIGIQLFCSKKAHLKFIFQLNMKDQELCISALCSSKIGNNYLNKHSKSLDSENKSTIEKIMSESKSEESYTNSNNHNGNNNNHNGNINNHNGNINNLNVNNNNHNGNNNNHNGNNKNNNIIIIDDESSQSDDLETKLSAPLKKKKKKHKIKTEQQDLKNDKKHTRNSEEDDLFTGSPFKKVKIEGEVKKEPQEFINSIDETNFDMVVEDGLNTYHSGEGDEYQVIDENYFSNEDGIEQVFELNDDELNSAEMNVEENSHLKGETRTSETIKIDLTTEIQSNNQKPTNETSKTKKQRKPKTITYKPTAKDEDSSVEEEQDMERKFNEAKHELQLIQQQFKKDEAQANLDYQRTHTYSVAAEKKAAKAIEKKIKPLYDDLIKYYSERGSRENSLKIVEITLRLIHEHPVDKSIFKSEMAKLKNCLDICKKIIKSAKTDKRFLAYQLEAEDFETSILEQHIAVLTYNYAALNHRKIKIKIATDSKDPQDIEGYIKHLENDIHKLQKSVKEYNKLKNTYVVAGIIRTINGYIAESYEDMADIKDGFFDRDLNQNPAIEQIELLQDIKNSYQESFELCQKNTVLLSVLNCQYRIIELYLSLNTDDSKNQALLELDNIIDVLRKNNSLFDLYSTRELLESKLESISTMLYACSTAFDLTNNEEYKTTALNYYNNNKAVIEDTNHLSQFNELHVQITRYLTSLNCIENRSELPSSMALPTLFHKKQELPENKAVYTVAPNSIATPKNISVNSLKSVTQKPVPKLKLITNIGNHTPSTQNNPLPFSNSFFGNKSNNTNSIKPLLGTTQPNKPQMTESKPVPNSNYSYEAEDIQAILKARMKHYPSVRILDVAELYPNNNNGVADVLNRFFDKQSTLMLAENQENVLLIPIHVSGNWVGLSVSLKEKEITNLTYFNSLKNTNVDKHRIQTISSQLGLNPEKNQIRPAKLAMQQADDTSSGVLLIENFYCNQANRWWKEGENDITSHDTQKMRQRHLEILKESDIGFYDEFKRRQFPSLTNSVDINNNNTKF